MRENYGPGSYSDQYDNQKSRSVDRDQHPGKVTNVPFEDEMDLTTNNFNPSHGEAYVNKEKKEPPRAGGVDSYERKKMNNLARSELRPDQHPNDRHYYVEDNEEIHKTDDELRKDILRVLDHSQEVHIPGIKICVEDGVVYLEGKFPSDGIQRVAVDLIESVPGVVDVFFKPLPH